jgi:hypothetical protein
MKSNAERGLFSSRLFRKQMDECFQLCFYHGENCVFTTVRVVVDCVSVKTPLQSFEKGPIANERRNHCCLHLCVNSQTPHSSHRRNRTLVAAYCWSISLVSASFICLRAAIKLVTVAFASSSALRAAVTDYANMAGVKMERDCLRLSFRLRLRLRDTIVHTVP